MDGNRARARNRPRMRRSQPGVGELADSSGIAPASGPVAGTGLRSPILWAAGAVYVGSSLGANRAFDPGVLVAALCIGVCAAIACATVSRVRAWRGLRESSAALIVLAAAALHASSSQASPFPAERAGAAVGRWSPSGAFGDDDLGRIAGSEARFAVPAGALAAGDLVAIGPLDELVLPAAGPVPGPNAQRGILPPRRALADEIVRIAPAERAPWWPLSEALARLRRACVERAAALDDPLTGSVVGALLLGETRALPDGVPDLFVRTGTYHVLAISGLQVALVAVLIVWPLGSLAAALVGALSLGRFQPGALGFRVALLALFVPVAGAGAPVVRSAIAWGLGALAPRIRTRYPFAAMRGPLAPLSMGRRADSLALWALALILECVAHPDSAPSLSVQLSYAATAGLILGTSPLLALARRALPGAGRMAGVDSLGRARSPLWRIPTQRAIDGTVAALAASAVAVLATLPFTWSRFGEWSPVGIFATAALVLPVLWTLVVGWTWIVWPGLVPEVLLDAPAHGMVRMLEILDRVPGSPDLLPLRPSWLVSAAVVLSFAWLVHAGRAPREPEDTRPGGRAGPWLQRAAAAAWVALLVPWSAAPRGLELWALDVGSGTAVAWRAPGAGAWVYDAGSRDRSDVAREALLPLLRHWEVSRLGIVLSHADSDHDGALPYLALRVAPAVWAGALPAHCAERLPHTTARLDVGIGTARLCAAPAGSAGLSLLLERGLARDDNEGSRALRLTWGSEEIVLTGDAEADGLRAWLAGQAQSRSQRLLLLPHHGSESELLGPLLAATRPVEAWVSGPAEIPIRAELDRRALQWRWTARDGPLWIELEPPQPAR